MKFTLGEALKQLDEVQEGVTSDIDFARGMVDKPDELPSSTNIEEFDINLMIENIATMQGRIVEENEAS